MREGPSLQPSHIHETLAVMYLQRGPPIAENKSTTHRTPRTHIRLPPLTGRQPERVGMRCSSCTVYEKVLKCTLFKFSGFNITVLPPWYSCANGFSLLHRMCGSDEEKELFVSQRSRSRSRPRSRSRGIYFLPRLTRCVLSKSVLYWVCAEQVGSALG